MPDLMAVLRAGALIGLGAAVGATVSVAAWSKLHPPQKPRPNLEAPPEMAPPPEEPEEPKKDVSAPDPLRHEPPHNEVPTKRDEIEAAKAEAQKREPPSPGPTFFGFRVGSPDRAPEPKPAPAVAEKPAPPPEPAKPAIVKLSFMKDRCVAGFDGKSTLHDFSGWTRAVTGTIEYEDGRLAETAKASCTIDAASLDTGDADRDKEMKDAHLETGKFPTMAFEAASVKMTGVESMVLAGTIEIHGVKKSVEIPCTIKVRRDKVMFVKGELQAKMTDFGIKPPSKMGLVNVEDGIRIWFEAWAKPVRAEK